MARGAFWTIIVDDQPTAFRAAVREDLLPTLKQLQRQHPGAVIKWFQRGRLWETPGEAMDAAKPPRRGSDWRPGGAHKDPRAQYKVPRDVKRARWAAQAAEGRGPWVKDSGNAERRAQNAERGPRPRRQAEAGRTPSAERRPPTGSGAGSAGAERRTPVSPKPRGEGGPKPTGGGWQRTRETRREHGDSFKPAWKPKGDRPENAERRTPGAERKPAWKPKGDQQSATGPARGDRRRPDSAKPGGGGGQRPKGAGPGFRAGAQRDWRGDRKTPRDAMPRTGGAPVKAAAPAPKRGKTWRVGELPPADRKRRKDDE